MTTIYLDTEFSSLTDNAVLLSVGAVTETGDVFYVELPTPPRCSAFVRANVLPLLEGGDAICSRAEFPARFADWLQQWPAPCVVIVDSDWDIYMLRQTLMRSTDSAPGVLTIASPGGPTVQVQIELMPPVAHSATVQYCDARSEQQLTDPRVHHALADAKVLRAGALACKPRQ